MITYRLLRDSELLKYAMFLKQRNSDSLNLYFGHAMRHEMIDHLVDGMVAEPHLHHVVVAEDIDEEIVGTVHIARMNDHEVEFGVMVAEAYRGKGIASGMMDYAMTWARNRGFRDLYMHCLSYNAPIKHLVLKHGLAISRDGIESDARVTMPPTNIFSIGHEIALRQQNAVNTTLNHTIQSFRRALAL
jgi:RimJ/RimL family protein N-acetyltransferase